MKVEMHTPSTERTPKVGRPARRTFPSIINAQDRRLISRRELMPRPAPEPEIVQVKHEEIDERGHEQASVAKTTSRTPASSFKANIPRPSHREGKIEYEDTNIDSSIRAMLLQRNKRIPAETLVALFRPPASQVALVFNHELDRRTFDYWRNVPAIEITRLSGQFAYLWLEDFPRSTLSSPMMKHMLLAHGYLHESLRESGDAKSANTYRAMRHYHEGIRLMSSGVDQLELLMGAWFAFIYEELRLEYASAMTHIKGCEAILKADTSSTGSRHDGNPFKEFVNFVVHVYLHRQEQFYQFEPAETQEEDLQLIAQARDDIIEWMDDVLQLPPDADLTEPRGRYLDWIASLRSYDAVSARTLNRDAVFICSTLAMGLTDWDLFASYSLLLEKNWQGSLDAIHLFLSPDYQQTHNMIDEDDLLTTLTTIATYLAQYVEIDPCRNQALALLTKIEARKIGMKMELVNEKSDDT